MTVTGVVLAAGGSRRLGRPKQLLPLRGTTMLDVVLATARSAALDQVVVALGGAAELVRARVDLAGVDVAQTPDFGEGCASSLRSALRLVRADADGIVLLLGDQPGVTAATVGRLVAAAGAAPVGVCRYDDGLGHPLWFGRSRFRTLRRLHGDKAVWKLVDAGDGVVEVPVPGPVPADVDTWEDYESLVRRERAVRR
jgi:molybdenum cofactor cytidylyltransferase